MTPTKLNPAPLTKRISVLALTAAAAFSFAAFSSTAHAADTKELAALKAALAPQTLENATATELADAVSEAIGANPKLKPGNIAGEALKNAGSNAQDGGDEIGAALAAANASNDTLAARDAIKRAGSGRNLNVNLVPDFSTAFITDNATAINLAKLVKSTKPGAGAVIGGRASQLTTTGAQVALANDALAKANKLAGAAQDILKYVVIEVDEDGGGAADTGAFAAQVAVANVNLAPKIGAGAVAGDPTNGGDIVDALLNETTLVKLKKGIAGFVKAAATVADIEEISKMAIAVGNQINTPIPTGSTSIKFAAAKNVVKNLAKAIVAKATTTDDSADVNRFDNKRDEIAETAAYLLAKALNTHVVNGANGGKPQVSSKNVGAKVFLMVISAVNATKGKKITRSHPGAADLYATTAIDVAGSVAQTLGTMKLDTANGVPAAYFDSIIEFLLKKAKNIGGSANETAVRDAINTAYAGTAGIAYEDGTITSNALISDPETDLRPF